MSYCLKPTCSHPQNPENFSDCLSCGSPLLLQRSYRALKPIGQGGFGRTFLAVDESQWSEPPCVIKQFFPQVQRHNHQHTAAELLHQEALQLSKLGQHPQIPQLLNFFEQDGQQYLVQEFIDGQNLEQELALEGAFNEHQIRELLYELLPVLQFVHDHQVIHRDIKPANIIRRNSDGQLVLVDFGAAKLATGTALAKTGTMIGSAEYTAPEQTRGKAVFASDLYSLGVTCIHLLTQISPFDLLDSSEDVWIWRDYLNFQLSESLAHVLDKLLQNATRRRYQSAADVLKDLTAAPKQVGRISVHFNGLELSARSLNFGRVLSFIEKGARCESRDSSISFPKVSCSSASTKPTGASSPVKPVLAVTIFDPQTQSWYRLSNLNEYSESVWAVAPFMRPRPTVTFPPPVNVVKPQVASTGAASLWRKRPMLYLIALGAGIIAQFSLGIQQHSPTTAPETGHSLSSRK